MKKKSILRRKVLRRINKLYKTTMRGAIRTWKFPKMAKATIPSWLSLRGVIGFKVFLLPSYCRGEGNSLVISHFEAVFVQFYRKDKPSAWGPDVPIEYK